MAEDDQGSVLLRIPVRCTSQAPGQRLPNHQPSHGGLIEDLSGLIEISAGPDGVFPWI